jgi:8-oxo-dGTP pyrophosphatase MutT (NUDIX family)
VILVRDGVDAVETFMVQRHARSRVAPSAYVFPGGTVRADDFGIAPDEAARARFDRADTPPEPAEAGAYLACAVRELFEEAGVLLARDRAAAPIVVDEFDQTLQERLAAARLALQAGQLTLGQLLDEHAWRPAFDLLVPFSHWVTPSVLAARFDTRFFVAEMPPRQEALHCTIETSEGIWQSPARLLDGDYNVVYATAQHLRRISGFATVADLLTYARAKPIRRVQPEVIERGAGLSVWLPPDLADNW